MDEKQVHNLAVLITKGIMGKDFLEDKAELVKYAFCMEWWDQGIQYEGHYDSVQECLDQAIGYLNVHYNNQAPIGTKVFVGEIVKTSMPEIDVEKLFEDIWEKYYDEFGQLADDYLSDVKKEHAAILSDELNSVFSKWLNKYHYLPGFYKVDNIKTYVYDGAKWVLNNDN